jgi:hypothetical protein
MSLKVEKIKVAATLYLTEGVKKKGFIFLSPFGAVGSRPQTVEELVSEREKVLPFEDSEEGFMLVGKAGIAAIGVGIETSSYEMEFFNATGVVIHLMGGFGLVGDFLVEKGLGFRPSDAINSDEPWFLLKSGDTVYLVSKKHLSTLKFQK